MYNKSVIRVHPSSRIGWRTVFLRVTGRQSDEETGLYNGRNFAALFTAIRTENRGCVTTPGEIQGTGFGSGYGALCGSNRVFAGCVSEAGPDSRRRRRRLSTKATVAR